MRFFSKDSFSLVELMVVVAIFIFIFGGIIMVLTVGQTTWQQTETHIELQQDLRKAMMRVTKELRESGFNSDVPPAPMVTIYDDTGENGTDILEFYIPVDYDNDGDIVDASGDIEWGAATLWANKDPDYQEKDYKIEYLVNADGQFIRRVLKDTSEVEREDIYANNILDFQVTRLDDIVTIQITVRKDSVTGRTITKSLTSKIFLRNNG